MPAGGSRLPMLGFIRQAYAKATLFECIPIRESFGRIHRFSRTKNYIQELAQTLPIRQLFLPFTAEGGIRLPRFRVMRQQPLFAQARWVMSIESIESDTVSLAVVEKGRNRHLSGRSKQVRELRICFCPVIARVN